LCYAVFAPHLGREFLDFRQVPLHFTPTVPEGVVRARMEGPLEGAHAMFEEHHEQLLLDDRVWTNM
jgi:hypothetical protein